MKRLIVAESAGFCAGVSRSVRMAEEALSRYGRVWCLGELIHNRSEVERLCALGLVTVEHPEEVPEGAAVLLRSHGVGRRVYELLERRGCRIIDATCGKVAAIHDIAARTETAGGTLIVFGDPDHPEVQGICGWCGRSLIAKTQEMLEQTLRSCADAGTETVNIVFQSTELRSNYIFSEKNAKKICTNAKVFDTICSATQIRQSDALDLGKKCNAVVVMGSKHSANSRHLVELCTEVCAHVQFAETAAEVNTSPLAAFDTIGITAGASVPQHIIKEVVQKMCDEIKRVEASEAESEKSFAELLEESIKTIYNGETVKGIVAAITPTEVTVDLGIKYSGYIPVEEFYDENGSKITDLLHIGDEVEACVVRVNEIEGTAMLSKRRLDAIKNWGDIEAAYENETVVEGIVTEENKGGLVVNVKGVRVFVPASQSGLPRDAALSQLLKQKVQLRIREANKARRRVVGSIRDVTAKARREAVSKIWEEIEVGKRYDGVVKSLTSYGAFVDIGGVDGMVHVSELSWKRIGKPADVISVGDAINVYVISFDKETHKISLGYKDADADPWKQFVSKHSVGDILPVTIVKMMPFGAFAEVLPGVDGLIHISQIANRRIGQPGEVLSIGEVVDVKLTAIDEEKHKVSLSIRAMSEPEPAPARTEAAPAAPEADALVYEVSENGESSGIAPEDAAE